MKVSSMKPEERHAIKVTLRQYYAIPLLLTAIMVFLLPGANIILRTSAFRRLVDFAESVGRGNLRGFSFYDDTLIVKFIPAVLMAMAALTALWLFRFLFSQKAQAVYFLTGISRGQLFVLRYVFGAVSLALSVGIALVLSTALDLAVFGPAEHLWANGLYLFGAMLSLALCCYSVCVVLMLLCGRLLDFFLTAAVVWSAPFLALLFLQNVFSAFLPGAPYYFGQGNSQKQYYPSLIEKFTPHYIANLFKASFESCGNASGHVETTEFADAVARFVKKPELIVLLLVISLLFGLLGRRLMKNRRAELAERPNAAPLLSGMAAALTALSLSSCIFLLGRGAGHLILFALLTVLLYWLMTAIFRGSIRRTAKTVPVSAALALAGLAVCGICRLGGLGYSAYLPQADKIASVKIGFMGHPQYAPANCGSTVTKDSPFYRYYASPDHLPMLTAEEDIAKALQVHRSLIADGSRNITAYRSDAPGETAVYADLYLTYTLKNGRTVTRFYRTLKLSTMETVLEIELTERYRELLASKLLYFGENERGLNSDEYLQEVFSGSVVYAADSLLANMSRVTLTVEEKQQLFDAILKDKSDDTVAERYRPEKECLGVLVISKEAVSAENENGCPAYDCLALLGPFSPANMIYVFEQDAQTLAFLREKGLIPLFEKSYRVTEMTLYRAALTHPNEHLAKDARDYVFYSQIDTDMTRSGGSLIRQVGETEYTEILQKARLCYFNDGGELVRIIVENEAGEMRTVTKYLPK